MSTRPGLGLDFQGDLKVNADAPIHFNTIKVNLDAINTAIDACGGAIQGLYNDGNRGDIFVGLESAITAIITALDSNSNTAQDTHDAALKGVLQIIELNVKYGAGLKDVRLS